MSIYTVHEPPSKADGSPSDPDRFVFVRDGFSFWAFLLAPLWMLRHWLWLVFVGYVVLAVALQIALRSIGASSTVMVTVGALLSLLVGFEAATLRRFTLAFRRWSNVGIVVGDDLEAAERRFFEAWMAGGAPARPSPTALERIPSPAPARPASEVLGLFPQPGAPR
jgi:hypothetical protein